MDTILIGIVLFILFGISAIASAYMTTRFFNNIIEIKSRIKIMRMAEKLYYKVLLFLLIIFLIFLVFLILIF